MSFYAPPNQIDQVDYAMDVGSKMLEYMEDFFGIKYSLPKAGKNLLLQRAKLYNLNLWNYVVHIL